jgi:hypothetical protein
MYCKQDKDGSNVKGEKHVHSAAAGHEEREPARRHARTWRFAAFTFGPLTAKWPFSLPDGTW